MRVLVVAASRHSSTSEVAEVIASEFRAADLEAVVSAPSDVEDVASWDAVVLGGAVYAGRWPQSATTFLDRFAEDLRARPVWLFSVGLNTKTAEEVSPYVESLLAATGARGHRLFAGRLEHRRLNLLERALMRVMRAPEGDFRDWAAIRSWAREVLSDLAEHRAADRQDGSGPS